MLYGYSFHYSEPGQRNSNCEQCGLNDPGLISMQAKRFLSMPDVQTGSVSR